MITRALKGFLFRRTRVAVSAGASVAEVSSLIVQLWNIIFGQGMVSTFFWRQIVKIVLLAKYKDSLTASELSRTYDLRGDINMMDLLQELQHRSGCEFSFEAIRKFEIQIRRDLYRGTQTGMREPFKVEDLLCIRPQLKTMQAIGTRASFLSALIASDAMQLPKNPFHHMKDEAQFRDFVLEKFSSGLSHVEALFGRSLEKAKFSLCAACTLLLHPSPICVSTAGDLLDESLQLLLQERTITLDLAFFYFYVRAQLDHLQLDIFKALRGYMTAFGILLRDCGEWVEELSVATDTDAYVPRIVLPPVSILLLNRILEAFQEAGFTSFELAPYHTLLSNALKLSPFPGDALARERVFGHEPTLVSSQGDALSALYEKRQWPAPVRAKFQALFPSKDPLESTAVEQWVSKALAMDYASVKSIPAEVLSAPEKSAFLVPYVSRSIFTVQDPYYIQGSDRPIQIRYLSNLATDVVEIGNAEFEFDLELRFGRQISQVPLYQALSMTQVDVSAAAAAKKPEDELYLYLTSEDRGTEGSSQRIPLTTVFPDRLPTSLLLFLTGNGWRVGALPHLVRGASPLMYRVAQTLYRVWVIDESHRLLTCGTSSDYGDATFPNFAPVEGIIGREFLKLDLCVSKRWNVNPGVLVCLLTTTGEVYTMGSNLYGATGAADRDRTKTPRLMTALLSSFIVDVCAGYSFAVALSKDGKAFIWGQFVKFVDSQFSVYDPHTVEYDESESDCVNFGAFPMEVKLPSEEKVICISAGAMHVVALTDHGDCYYAGLKQGVPGAQEAGVFLDWTLMELFERGDTGEEAAIRVQSVACGFVHTLLLSEDGRVFSFGNNTCVLLLRYREHSFFFSDHPVGIVRRGQLGIGTRESRFFESDMSAIRFYGFGTVGADRPPRIVQIAAREFSSAALDEEGTVWLFGGCVLYPVPYRPTNLPRPIASVEWLSDDHLTLHFEKHGISALDLRTQIRFARKLLIDLVCSPARRTRVRKPREQNAGSSETMVGPVPFPVDQGALALLVQQSVAAAVKKLLEPILARLETLEKKVSSLENAKNDS